MFKQKTLPGTFCHHAHFSDEHTVEVLKVSLKNESAVLLHILHEISNPQLWASASHCMQLHHPNHNN